MIIDHHVHLGLDTNKSGFSLTAEELMRKMNLYGIDKSIVFACPNITPKDKNPYQEENKKILAASRKYKQLIPFMFVNPFLDTIDYLEKTQVMFSGFKVYATANQMGYSYSKALDKKQMQMLIEIGKPMLFHTGKVEGSRVDDLLCIIKASKGLILLAHSGRLFKQGLERVAKYDHVYIDISPIVTNIELEKILLAPPEERDLKLSKINPQKVIDYLERLFNGRVIWGSDTPWCDNLIKEGYKREIEVRKYLRTPENTFLSEFS